MPVDALSAFTITLHDASLTCIPAPPTSKADLDSADPGYSGSVAPQDSTQALVKRDMPVYLRRFSRGAGFVEMRDADEDDGGYAWVEDAFTHLGNGITPSGRRVTSAT